VSNSLTLIVKLERDAVTQWLYKIRNEVKDDRNLKATSKASSSKLQEQWTWEHSTAPRLRSWITQTSFYMLWEVLRLLSESSYVRLKYLNYLWPLPHT